MIQAGDGGAGLVEEAIEQRVVFVGMKLVAEQAGGARAEPHPIRQHGLREQLAKFVDARVVHNRGRVVAENLACRKLKLQLVLL